MSGRPPTDLTMSVPPQIAGADRLDRVTSPAVAAVRAAPDPLAAADELWRTAARDGTPLVETLDDGTIAATFLWRGDAAEMFLVANKIADVDTFDECRFERVEHTDVWSLSFRVGRDWRASYGLAAVPHHGRRPDTPLGELLELRRSRSLAAAPPEAAPALNRWFDALWFAAPDPLAREQLDATMSVASMPDAPPQPWVGAAPAAGAGTTVTWEATSEALGTTRTISAHRTPGADGEPVPVVVLLDGEAWLDLPLSPALDAMVEAGALAPLVAVFVPSLDFVTRVRDLTCNPAFVDFLADEVLTAAGAHWPAHTDADHVTIAGQSLGGLTALYAGCARPDVFGNVVSQSGSYWWPNATTSASSEWLTAEVRAGCPLPRFTWLEVGLQEWVLLEPTRRMRDALTARGARLDYREFNGGHDRACWRGSLLDALTAVPTLSPAGGGRLLQEP